MPPWPYLKTPFSLCVCRLCLPYLFFLCVLQNAPQRFQVILVATDTTAESASVNLEIGKQFAAEKNLELVVCDLDSQEHVDKAFLKLIDKIMINWEGDINGKCYVASHNSMYDLTTLTISLLQTALHCLQMVTQVETEAVLVSIE